MSSQIYQDPLYDATDRTENISDIERIEYRTKSMVQSLMNMATYLTRLSKRVEEIEKQLEKIEEKQNNS